MILSDFLSHFSCGVRCLVLDSRSKDVIFDSNVNELCFRNYDLGSYSVAVADVRDSVDPFLMVWVDRE
ncbi:protein of unknown function [Ruminococcaceae bacterium BL-6]|nr:protein of unknown function [Ruminococcaceae bacterium BL-6]